MGDLPPGFQVVGKSNQPSDLPPGFSVVGKQEEPKSAMQQAFDKFMGPLRLPEQLSRQGLQQIAGMIPQPKPTGSIPLDLLKNTPKIAANTMAKVAPSFVSPASILMGMLGPAAKLAGPVVKGTGGALAKAGESLSGLEYKTPGVLTDAAKDATLLFGKGRKAAGQAYTAAKEVAEGVRAIFTESTSHKDVVDAGMKFAREGNLNPTEALYSRQSLDAIRKSVPKASFENMRDIFDKIAKPLFESADTAFSRAVRSEALRLLAPQNKLGGASVAKIAIGSALGPKALISVPAVQGALATGGGLAARTINDLAKLPLPVRMALPPSLKRFLRKKSDDTDTPNP